MSAKLAFLVASAALLAPGIAWADPVAPSQQWNGTWKLNTASSKFSTPVGKRTETRTYKVAGNKVTMHSKGTDASGKPMSFSYTAALDGKWYPMVGNPVGDSISLMLVNPRQVKSRVALHKKPTGMATADLSADGKHLTLNRRTRDAKGAESTDVLAYDRVP